MLEFTLLSPETSDSLDTESVSLPLIFNNFVICFSTTFCNFLSVLMDGGGGVTVGECFSFDCNMNLYVLDGSMRGQKYRDNIIRNIIVSYFDNKTDIHGQ
jgi:hypothetical protein